MKIYNCLVRNIDVYNISQILLDDSSYISPEGVSKKKIGDTSMSSDSVFFIERYLDTDKAVQIIDGAIEIDEELLQPYLIYPVELNGEKFYVRKIKGGAGTDTCSSDPDPEVNCEY
jgi:hypothetical protein